VNKQERGARLRLTLLITAFYLCFFLVTQIFVGIVVYILISFNMITGYNRTEPSVLRILLSYGIPCFLVSTILTSLLGKYPLRPVNGLIVQMNRLARGDYQARISFGSFWERQPAVAQLKSSFNSMVQELESTEKLRSEFVNNFSHEFKTPIVSIAGFAKLLRRGNLTEQQKDEYLAIIEEESLRLAGMATNVLNLTKIENQTILTDVTAFNLSEQIRSSLLLLERKWENRCLDFGLEFDEYTIHANEELLRHVWINLLDNAIKFTPEGGFVDVKIRKNEDKLTVTVSNTGSEISPEAQEKIFNKFYQADESHSSEGYGVGLSIVSRVVELHRGQVSVESGEGMTRFIVELPEKP